MNVLLLCDDYWHPGGIPDAGARLLEEKGYTFDIIYDADDFSPDMLKNYSVVMICKSNEKSQAVKEAWMTDAVQDAFVEYVESGGGLLAVHSATVPSKGTEKFSKLIGCKFTYHPNACPVTVAPIMPHPVTAEVNTFCETDEHYRLEILADDALVVMASYSAAQGEPDKMEEDPYHNTTQWLGAAGLVRKQGDGRVCVLTPGHLLPVWENSEFQKTLDNALRWCAT